MTDGSLRILLAIYEDERNGMTPNRSPQAFADRVGLNVESVLSAALELQAGGYITGVGRISADQLIHDLANLGGVLLTEKGLRYMQTVVGQ